MAASPGENFVLQLLKEVNQPNLVHMNVLDVAVAGVADTVALVEWAYSAGAAPVTHMAGFSVMRFDTGGNLLWQLSRTLCTLNNFECGKWEIEGHLARASNGFVVAGSGIKIDDTTRKPLMFALRINDAGAILWSRTYEHQTPLAEFGRIVSVATMGTADHFLVAANTAFDRTWLIEIDGGGNVVNSASQHGFQTTRLRATPSQGIWAVGAAVSPAGTLPAIVNFDAAAFDARWMLTYSFGLLAPLPGVRWLDVAEGNATLLVVGQMKTSSAEHYPLMAYLETDPYQNGRRAGVALMAFHPGPDAHAVRWRGVSAFLEKTVEIAPSIYRAFFVVCGEVQQAPWQFQVDEEGSVLWQKRYRLPGGATGALTPSSWPAFHHILAGGVVQSGGRSNGFLTSSPVILRPRDPRCSEGTSVELKRHELRTDRVTPSFDPLFLEARDCFLEAGPPLRVKKACLDSQ
jgi:hypothetical protein